MAISMAVINKIVEMKKASDMGGSKKRIVKVGLKQLGEIIEFLQATKVAANTPIAEVHIFDMRIYPVVSQDYLELV